MQLSWAYNDGREMHKDVFAAVFRRYETYAFAFVKPFDAAFDFCHRRVCAGCFLRSGRWELGSVVIGLIGLG